MKLKYLFSDAIIPLSILIPIGMFILNFRSAKKADKLLFGYLVSSGLINLVAVIISYYKIKNLPLLHLYTATEGVFIFGYFRAIFQESSIKRILTGLMVIFPVWCLLNFIFFQRNSYNTYTRPPEAIIITFFCLLYLYKSGFAENWLKKAVNWYNIGILVYFPSSFIIFVLSNLMVAGGNKSMNYIVWMIHNSLIFIMYLIWARGFKLMKNG